MSFEAFDSLFLQGMDLTPYENSETRDIPLIVAKEKKTLASLHSNSRIPEMFHKPSHVKGFIPQSVALRGFNHSESDFTYVVKSSKFNSSTNSDVFSQQIQQLPLQPPPPAQSAMIQAPTQLQTPPQQLAHPEISGQEIAAIQKSNLNVLQFKHGPIQLQLLDNMNIPIGMKIECKLDGKFYLNSRFLSKISTDTIPIACYRRNYINLDVDLLFTNHPCWLIHDNFKYHIESLFLELTCTSNFSGGDPEITFFQPVKPPSTTSALGIDGWSSYSPKIQLYENINDTTFSFKRFQFKKATPNNGKFIVKDYYYLNVMLMAQVSPYDPSTGSKRPQPFDIPITHLTSQPISVRGRNPSFYNNRDDIRISKA